MPTVSGYAGNATQLYLNNQYAPRGLVSNIVGAPNGTTWAFDSGTTASPAFRVGLSGYNLNVPSGAEISAVKFQFAIAPSGGVKVLLREGSSTGNIMSTAYTSGTTLVTASGSFTSAGLNNLYLTFEGPTSPSDMFTKYYSKFDAVYVTVDYVEPLRVRRYQNGAWVVCNLIKRWDSNLQQWVDAKITKY